MRGNGLLPVLYTFNEASIAGKIGSFRRKPEFRVPGENRDPVFEMIPDFRRDDVWTPAFAGETTQKTFYEIIKIDGFVKSSRCKAPKT